MSLFTRRSKSPEQKELERRIGELDRFIGSLSEYNIFKDQEHAIMDTGRARKFVNVDHDPNIDLLKQLLDGGCVGFVRYVPRQPTYAAINGGYGIPVRKT